MQCLTFKEPSISVAYKILFSFSRKIKLGIPRDMRTDNSHEMPRKQWKIKRGIPNAKLCFLWNTTTAKQPRLHKFVMSNDGECFKGETLSDLVYCYYKVLTKNKCVGNCFMLKDVFKRSLKMFAITITITLPFKAGLGGSVGCSSDWRQEVAGSTPAEVGNILSWRLIIKYFLRSFSPFRWFKKGSLSGERMCTILVNR